MLPLLPARPLPPCPARHLPNWRGPNRGWLALMLASLLAGMLALLPGGAALARSADLARGLGAGSGAQAGARKATVALTFDDVPGLTILPDQTYVDRFNADLLAGLKRHHFPAAGFVNAGKLDDLVRLRQIATLKSWAAAGMTLGNHTYSHESPNTLGADAYIADIQRGEPVIRALLAPRHQPLVWFRHPYLETGATAPQMRQIDGWLGAHGYRVAPVTIDADDWEFAEPYDDAIARKDVARQQAIRAEYLDYTEAMIGWSQASAHALFGRNIAYVMMLHDSRLNADCIDDLAALLKRHKLKPVTLDKALRDPAYRTPTPFEGPDGIEWLERWSLALKKPLPWENFRDMPKDIVTDYNRVDSDGK